MKIDDKLFSLIPLESIEPEAQQQIWKIYAMPFCVRMAIMPDVHTGYTMPIGGVGLFRGVISPSCVGFDIGCGMCAIKSNIEFGELDDRDKRHIFNEIYRRIPTGPSSRSKQAEYDTFESDDSVLREKINDRVRYQLGTLGGGNHFIEIGEDTEGKLAIVLHSGSRRAGWDIADYWMKLSKSVDTDLPPGFLAEDSDHGKGYLKDMRYASSFALANRKQMMLEIIDIIGLEKRLMNAMINENHNDIEIVPEGIIHRKGATPAKKGQLGVIPGSMYSGTYITKGLGNQDYLESASHGAGRVMSRSKAKKTLSLDDFKTKMEGIIAKVDESTLDESPDAYKNLGDVIRAQRGIVVDVINRITPRINVKG